MKTSGGFLISRIKHLSDRIFEERLKNSGTQAFNGAQGRILYVLWEHAPLSISEISKKTSLANTTLTSMLDRMEQKELLFRKQNPENRREVLISLTPKAKAYESSYHTLSQEMNALYYKNFSNKDIAVFEKMLSQILKNLEEST